MHFVTTPVFCDAAARRVHNNPYAVERPAFVEYTVASGAETAAVAPAGGIPKALPPRTLHGQLLGHVAFIPYPTVDAAALAAGPAEKEKEEWVEDGAEPTTPEPEVDAAAAAAAPIKLFLGQLPYDLTPAQVLAICRLFGATTCRRAVRLLRKNRVLDDLRRRRERLLSSIAAAQQQLQQAQGAARRGTEQQMRQMQRELTQVEANIAGQPVMHATGSFHVMVDEASFAALEQNLNKRVLLDRTGMWFAATSAQKVSLDDYCRHLRDHRDAIHVARDLRGHPLDTVVVQRAVSQTLPPKPQRHNNRRPTEQQQQQYNAASWQPELVSYFGYGVGALPEDMLMLTNSAAEQQQQPVLPAMIDDCYERQLVATVLQQQAYATSNSPVNSYSAPVEESWMMYPQQQQYQPRCEVPEQQQRPMRYDDGNTTPIRAAKMAGRHGVSQRS